MKPRFVESRNITEFYQLAKKDFVSYYEACTLNKLIFQHQNYNCYVYNMSVYFNTTKYPIQWFCPTCENQPVQRLELTKGKCNKCKKIYNTNDIRDKKFKMFIYGMCYKVYFMYHNIYFVIHIILH